MTVEQIGSDGEELAKAIVRSMLEEQDISKPGPATMALVQSTIGGIAEVSSIAELSHERLHEIVRKLARAAWS